MYYGSSKNTSIDFGAGSGLLLPENGVALVGRYKNFEENDRKDLEQIASRNLDVNDLLSEGSD
jgi:hypothetical protein